jgi:hypothetical protein
MARKLNALGFIIVAIVAVFLFAHARFSTSYLSSQSAKTQDQSAGASLALPHPELSPQSNGSAANSLQTTSEADGDNSLNWQTYTDKIYGFKLAYPRSGSLTVIPGGLDENNTARLEAITVEFIQKADPLVGNFEDTFQFSVTAYSNPEQLTAKQWALKQWDADVIREQEDIAINGVPAYKLRNLEIDQDSDYIYLAKGSGMYQLSYWDPQTMYDFSSQIREQYTQTFDRMVRSFAVE